MAFEDPFKDWMASAIGKIVFIDCGIFDDDEEMDQLLSAEESIHDDTALPDEEWEAKVQQFLAEHAQRHLEP